MRGRTKSVGWQFRLLSTIDSTIPSPPLHFAGGNALGDATADDVTITATRVNTGRLEEPREPDDWGSVAAHELMHNLGLLDMYPYDGAVQRLPRGRI